MGYTGEVITLPVTLLNSDTRKSETRDIQFRVWQWEESKGKKAVSDYVAIARCGRGG